MSLDYTIDNGEGEPRTVRLPTHWTICDDCQGEGTTSAHMGSWTQSEWADEDPDFREDYLRGAYDRPCETCKGSGKVKVINRDACTEPEQIEALAHMDALEQDRRETEAMYAAERRMGA